MMSDMHAKTSLAAMETATDLLPSTSAPMEPKVIFHGLGLLQRHCLRHIQALKDGGTIARVFTIVQSSLIGVTTKGIMASNRSITDSRSSLIRVNFPREVLKHRKQDSAPHVQTDEC